MQLRILHLEDDPQDRELVASAIEREGLAPEIVAVATLTEFEAALRHSKFDLILAEFVVPT